MTFDALCALLPDLMTARMQDIIRNSNAPFGPSSQERPALLAKLDAEIADLERRHEELVDAAAEVGIARALGGSVSNTANVSITTHCRSSRRRAAT